MTMQIKCSIRFHITNEYKTDEIQVTAKHAKLFL